jgi:hypothetical protein
MMDLLPGGLQQVFALGLRESNKNFYPKLAFDSPDPKKRRFGASIFSIGNATNSAIETAYRFNILNPEISVKYAIRSLVAAADVSLTCYYQLVSYFLPESLRSSAQPILDVFPSLKSA